MICSIYSEEIVKTPTSVLILMFHYINRLICFKADKTNNLVGISETLVATSLSGIVFALISGQPLLVIGTTGPLLLFDESLYGVS